VRILVDEFGSKPFKQAHEMFMRLIRAGAQMEVSRFLRDAPGRVDHRKLYVIDGVVAWTGGAGIEDHFEDGRFHDVMVRVTGDVVRQAQAAFLSAFRARSGELPAGLAHLFPEPDDAGSTPIALAQVLPGGFVAAAQATLEQIGGARERLDVMNPYLTDSDAIERIIAAARRGAKVRVVVSERSNNHMATAALEHRYGDLIEAGVELWELPGTVVHAKVVIADDVVSFGTVNLDAWALSRNAELMMIARSAALAAQFEEHLFEPDIARAKPGRPPAGTRARAKSWACHKLAYYL
jgi:cardiolipin synthase